MGIWNYYVVTEKTPITRKDLKRYLSERCPSLYMNGDIIARKSSSDAEPNYENDLELGQFQMSRPKNGLKNDDRELFEEWAKEKKAQDKIRGYLSKAQSLLVVQLLNVPLWGEVAEETLDPLWDWLLAQKEGLLIGDGGDFYDKNGPLE